MQGWTELNYLLNTLHHQPYLKNIIFLSVVYIVPLAGDQTVVVFILIGFIAYQKYKLEG